MKNLDSIKARMEEILADNASANLKMPFIPHIHMSLCVAESIANRLTPADYEKLVLIILCHDLIMKYDYFNFPDRVLSLLREYGVNLADLRIISFKHLRDVLGHNDWNVIVPSYVSNLVKYNNEICLIHSLICWNNHIIYCVKNHDQTYLKNLHTMYCEFARELADALSGYGYQALITDLLGQYKLQLELAETALHPAAATHL